MISFLDYCTKSQPTVCVREAWRWGELGGWEQKKLEATLCEMLENGDESHLPKRSEDVHAVLGSHLTDSRCLTTTTNEHGNRTNCAYDESRCADHCDDQVQGISNGALYQILERI